jgi:hypothetical protein
VIIADHHKPGHWLPTDTDYKPTCAWPEKCIVQWGSSGVVASESGCYRTAFFEAFPGNEAGGYIRGEGATIAEAEADAFSKYSREIGCNHRWGRKGYLNGGAFCYHCGAFKKMFKEVHILGDWRKPITKMEDEFLDMNAETEGGKKLQHRLRLRKKLFGATSSYL